MALFLALSRDSNREDLGEFETLRISANEIRTDKDQVIAWHSQHRWRGEHSKQTYNEVHITGPLTVGMGDAQGGQKFGPYGEYKYVDGVAYADGRVFAFWDIANQNWYLTDVGVHCKALAIAFVRPVTPKGAKAVQKEKEGPRAN